jgi:hypothetical protein
MKVVLNSYEVWKKQQQAYPELIISKTAHLFKEILTSQVVSNPWHKCM